jgi:hypothetical protein
MFPVSRSVCTPRKTRSRRIAASTSPETITETRGVSTSRISLPKTRFPLGERSTFLSEESGFLGLLALRLLISSRSILIVVDKRKLTVGNEAERLVFLSRLFETKIPMFCSHRSYDARALALPSSIRLIENKVYIHVRARTRTRNKNVRLYKTLKFKI